MHKNIILTVIATVLLVKASNSLQQQISKSSLQVIKFLMLDKQNCYKLQDFSFEVSSWLQDEEFIKFAKEDNMKDTKQRLQEMMDTQIQEELEKVQTYYNTIKQKVINDFDQYYDEMKLQIGQKTIQDFNNIFYEQIQNKAIPLDIGYMQKEVEFLKEIKQLDMLKEKVFKKEENNQYCKDFFLYDDKSKEQIIKQIFFGDENQNMINKNWQEAKQQYKNSLLFIKVNYKFSQKSDQDYLQFVDFYASNNKDDTLIKNGEFLLLDKAYLNFQIFDSLFADYEQRDLEFYKVIYKVLADYRIKNLHKEVSIIGFLKYFDEQIQEQDKYLYYAAKILLYYKITLNKQEIQPAFNKNIKPDSEQVVNLIEDRDDIRKFAKQINKQFSLKLKINTLENLISDKAEEQYEQAIDTFFKTQIIKKKQDVYQNDEISELINDLNVTDEVQSQKKRSSIIKSVVKYTMQNYINSSQDQYNDWNHYQVLIDQILLQNKDIANLQFLKILLKELSDQNNDYLMYLDKMNQFFNHRYFKLLIVEKTEEFQLNNQTQSFCEELQMDLDMLESQLQACSKLQIKTKRLFQDNYIVNFVKFMSFIRIFDYYNNDNNHIVYYFVQMYKFIVLNKSQYSFDSKDSVTLSLSKNLDEYLQVQRSRKPIVIGASKYFLEIETIHDILKILNLRNYFVGQDQQLINKAEFPYTVFQKLSTLLYFQSDSKISDQLLKLLEQIRSHFSNEAKFYAFNLLYLIIKSNEIIQSTADQQSKYTKILAITKSINNFESDQINKYYLKTSRNLALFYYQEYLNFLKNPKNTETIKQVFVEDIKRLNFQEKLFLFGNKILGLLDSSFEYSNITSNDFNLDTFESKSFSTLIAKKYKVFQQNDQYKGTLVKSLAAFELLKILIKNNDFEKIEKESLMEEIQYNTIELFNLQQNSQQEYVIRFKKIADIWLEKDDIHSDNVYLFNYYLLTIFLSRDRLILQNQNNTIISQKAHLFVNQYFQQKNQGVHLSNEDQIINSEDLYFISQIIFSYAFKDAKFESNSELKRGELNTKVASLWLFFNREGHEQLKQIKDENFLLSIQQLNHVIPDMTQNHSIGHKHLNYLEETFRGIFEQRCRFEQFDFILNHCDYKQNEYILLQTIKQCNTENDTKILNNYVYQMLKAIYDSLKTRFFEINQSTLVHKNLLDELKSTSIIKLDTKQYFLNLKRIFSTNYQVNYTQGFSDFLHSLWNNFDYTEVQKLIDSEIVSVLVKNDNKEEFKRILILDTLLFAQGDKELKFDNLMLHKQDLLSLMLQKLRYTNFLTRIFSQGDYSKKDNIERYFQIYSTVVKTRIQLIQDDILSKDQVEDVKVQFLDDTEVQDPATQINKVSNSVLYFKNIFFVFYVHEVVRGFDSLKGRAYKCKVLDIILNLIGQDKQISVNTDLNENSKFLQINQEIKSNFDYFYKVVQRILNQKVIPGEEKCMSNEKEIMQDFLDLYKQINKDSEIKNSNRFEYGIQEKTLQIDKETEFGQKKNLFI